MGRLECTFLDVNFVLGRTELKKQFQKHLGDVRNIGVWRHEGL